MCRSGRWSYQENNLYQWKDLDDISKLPMQELLSKYSVSEDLQQFLNENFIPIQQREEIKEEIQTEKKEDPIIVGDDVVTIEDLKKEYDYVFDNDSSIITSRKVEKREVPYTSHLPDGTTVQKTREENGKVSDHLFFKDSNGIVTNIPELSAIEEGDIDGPFAVAVSVVAKNDGQIVWFTSSDFLDEMYNAYSSGANLDLAMNAISSMIEENEAVAIRSKSLNYNYLTISASTASFLKTIMIILFPLLYLGIGICVTIGRRKWNEAK